MKTTRQIIVILLLLASINLYSQTIKFDERRFDSNHVSVAIEKVMGKMALRVVKDSTVKEADEPTFARTKEIDFSNGTIEVSVLSRLLKNAPATARGFIGVAFRINDTDSRFECIYIRPTNGRADDQVRRNHSIQYFSFPDYKFDRLRKESPEKYESYADMGLNEWIKLKIEVKGKQAKLFINENKQPSLIVNDLKHGDHSSGAVGLYVDNGTEGFFTDLKIGKD
ncbi:MAG TPA: family 16 glycoside hydrolase [Chryseolinea sp.]|nr:family 16 glycoside hydrolase [Chryseolinea sp.]